MGRDVIVGGAGDDFIDGGSESDFLATLTAAKSSGEDIKNQQIINPNTGNPGYFSIYEQVGAITLRYGLGMMIPQIRSILRLKELRIIIPRK